MNFRGVIFLTELSTLLKEICIMQKLVAAFTVF